MPLNCFDGTYRSFEQQVLPEVELRGIAALGMKSLGGDGQPILHGVVTAEEALRYAGFKPMAPKQMQALRQRCKSFAADGHLELYKRSAPSVEGGRIAPSFLDTLHERKCPTSGYKPGTSPRGLGPHRSRRCHCPTSSR